MSFLCKIARRVPVFKEVISGLIQQKMLTVLLFHFQLKVKNLQDNSANLTSNNP